MRIALLALGLAGCGMHYWSNGVRPTPRGEARVLLVAVAGGWTPVACYDPDWIRLAGPADCGDLIPPGAQVRPLAGGAPHTLGDRAPARCGEVPAVAFPDATAAGLAVWPPEAPGTAAALDLDADGLPELVEYRDGQARVHARGMLVGACP
ncbi:MAG: hypothetical protein R3F60_00165 [bacterium]